MHVKYIKGLSHRSVRITAIRMILTSHSVALEILAMTKQHGLLLYVALSITVKSVIIPNFLNPTISILPKWKQLYAQLLT
jgi:hypothetical protein